MSSITARFPLHQALPGQVAEGNALFLSLGQLTAGCELTTCAEEQVGYMKRSMRLNLNSVSEDTV